MGQKQIAVTAQKGKQKGRQKLTQAQKAYLKQQTKFIQKTITEINEELGKLSDENYFIEIDVPNEHFEHLKDKPEIKRNLPTDGNYDGTASDKGYTEAKDTSWQNTTADSHFSPITENHQDMYTQLQKQAYELVSNSKGRNSALNRQEFSILVILINHIDEHGFLSEPIEPDELSQETFIDCIQDIDINHAMANLDAINKYIRFEMELEDLSIELQKVFSFLQELKPAGIGARNQQEFFIYQVTNCKDFPEWGIKIFSQHFNDMLKQEFHTIALALGKEDDDIIKALHCLPRIYFYPRDYYVPQASYVCPDVKISPAPQKTGEYITELTPIKPALYKSDYLDRILSQNSTNGNQSTRNRIDELDRIDEEMEPEIGFDSSRFRKKDIELEDLEAEETEDEESEPNASLDNNAIKAESFYNNFGTKHPNVDTSKIQEKIKQVKAIDKVSAEMAEKALVYMRLLGYRQGLLLGITKYIVKEEKEFFNSDCNDLFAKPLVQADCAKSLGVDPARISNILNEKTAEIVTSNGTIYKQLKWFFSREEEIRNFEDILKNIIEQEDKSNPYRDDDICKILKDEHNIKKARLAIVRARKKLGIPNRDDRKIAREK